MARETENFTYDSRFGPRLASNAASPKQRSGIIPKIEDSTQKSKFIAMLRNMTDAKFGLTAASAESYNGSDSSPAAPGAGNTTAENSMGRTSMRAQPVYLALATWLVISWATGPLLATEVGGGGSKRRDCLVTFDAAVNLPSAKPKHVRCTDGDPACDSDGVVNGIARSISACAPTAPSSPSAP